MGLEPTTAWTTTEFQGFFLPGVTGICRGFLF